MRILRDVSTALTKKISQIGSPAIIGQWFRATFYDRLFAHVLRVHGSQIRVSPAGLRGFCERHNTRLALFRSRIITTLAQVEERKGTFDLDMNLRDLLQPPASGKLLLPRAHITINVASKKHVESHKLINVFRRLSRAIVCSVYTCAMSKLPLL